MQQINSFAETYRLSDGSKVASIGFGTYKTSNSAEDIRAYLDAIEVGYRYFDTASIYETERPLGRAIASAGVPREELYIATKLWHDEMGSDNPKAAIERSLSRLGTDYVDLYLIHWPRAADDNGDWREKLRRTWFAMEELVDSGKVKSIGLSNFLPHHIDIILRDARIQPVVDQLEAHIGYSQEVACAYAQDMNILPQAWSPLGRSDILGHPYVVELAKKYGKSPSQIGLRFLIQKGIMPIVKSSSIDRMKENIDIFDFEIDDEDMWMLTCMPQNTWRGEHPDFSIPRKESNFAQ